jgi:hypothetical protein
MTTIPASQYIRQGQNFVRYKRVLSGSPSYITGADCGAASAAVFDVAVQSLKVGPQSSFDRYKVYYYNDANQLAVELGSFSTKNPWNGRLSAYPSVIIDPLEQEGNLYVVPQTTYNSTSAASPYEEIFFPQTIDIVGYFEAQPRQAIERDPYIVDSALPISGGTIGGNYTFFTAGRRVIDIILYSVADLTREWTIYGFFGGYLSTNFLELQAASTVNGGGGIAGVTTYHYEAEGLDASRGYFDAIRVYLSGTGAGTPANDPSTTSDGGVRILFTARD